MLSNLMRDIPRIARKELGGFFASPAAFLFLGAFLLAVLFSFFWLETFFARNIADVRPLFKWLPVWLIFLVAALSMRTWSEERRAGTLETLMTSPVSLLSLVLGKFVAGLALVALALLLTLPIPFTVFLLGPLDFGPVWGGYLATLFLAAAYLAIGQFMSARTDNPVVALIMTSLLCGAFYLIGAESIGGLFSTNVAHWLSLIGTGSRFESITRGVIDLRDLYYYVSLVGVFLSLNLFALERLRRVGNPPVAANLWRAGIAMLIAANFVAANFWLLPIKNARADLTAGQMYSLSQATRNTLSEAHEPLLIRGYFSSQTHPLLAPLVPQLKDLLQEYGVAGGKNVRVEFINPQESPEKEEEANARYGVRPVPLQSASKYQTSVVNSYLNVVVAYGDQSETLSFRDLIDAKAREGGDFDVRLRDPEYAVTRAIRKVLGGYRAGASVFDNLPGNVLLKAYVSAPEALPEGLRDVPVELEKLADSLRQESGGRFDLKFENPEADGGLLAQELVQRYGLRPQIASLADGRPFWFRLMLEAPPASATPVMLPADLSAAGLRESIETALKSLAPGNIKTVGLLLPSGGQAEPPAYTRMRQSLEENARVVEVSLTDGKVPADVDLLMLLAPDNLNESQVQAIDQFLMRGGSVVVTTSPFSVALTNRIETRPHSSGLEQWLAFNGITLDKSMAFDMRSATLPVPSMRRVGPVMVPDVRMLPYPAFVDVRGADLAANSPIMANLNQLTIEWASPIALDQNKLAGRKVLTLAKTSEKSWRDAKAEAMPDFEAHPDTGFAMPDKPQASSLAVSVEGRFQSYFSKQSEALASGIKTQSPDTARLVLVASNSFGSDLAIDIVSRGMGALYTAPTAFLQNAVDWSLEDGTLLSLRGRSQTAHTLDPVGAEAQQIWEAANYVLALLGLGFVWLARRLLMALRARRYRSILKEVGA